MKKVAVCSQRPEFLDRVSRIVKGMDGPSLEMVPVESLKRFAQRKDSLNLALAIFDFDDEGFAESDWLDSIKTESIRSPYLLVSDLPQAEMRKNLSQLPLWRTLNSSDLNSTFISLLADYSDLKMESQRINDLIMVDEKKGSVEETACKIIHEINNPLSIIVSKAGRLLRRAEKLEVPDSQRREILEDCKKILSMGERITKLSRETLTFAGIKNREPAKSEKAFLINMVWMAIEETKHYLDQYKVEVSEDIDLNLEVFCDTDAMVQVFHNLLKNSCHALENESDRWIRIKAERHVDNVTIIYTDSGKGIPKEIAEKIFDPFFSTKTSTQGSGLGLSIVRSFLENMGGQITYQSKEPHTTFEIKLPLDSSKN